MVSLIWFVLGFIGGVYAEEIWANRSRIKTWIGSFWRKATGGE